jgi:hypothetical protein
MNTLLIKPKYLQQNDHKCHFAHHKSPNCPGTDPGTIVKMACFPFLSDLSLGKYPGTRHVRIRVHTCQLITPNHTNRMAASYTGGSTWIGRQLQWFRYQLFFDTEQRTAFKKVCRASTTVALFNYLAGEEPSPLIGLLYQIWMIVEQFVEWRRGRWNLSTWRTPDPKPLLPPQVPYLTCSGLVPGPPR